MTTKSSVQLMYGRGTISVELPRDARAHIISKPAFPPLGP